jgi:hypothetical protein
MNNNIGDRRVERLLRHTERRRIGVGDRLLPVPRLSEAVAEVAVVETSVDPRFRVDGIVNDGRRREIRHNFGIYLYFLEANACVRC